MNWISVRDRLPEDQVEVLVATRSKMAYEILTKGIWQSTTLSIVDVPRLLTGCHCQNHQRRKHEKNNVSMRRLRQYRRVVHNLANRRVSLPVMRVL